MAWYFAYGSNMDEDRMKERGCTIKQRIKGTLKGYTLVFNKKTDSKMGAGYANVSLTKNGNVEGVVYETDVPSINKLDVCEGVPKHYMKQNLSVETSLGKLKCIVYVANPSQVENNLKPTKDYLRHLLKGRAFLSEEYFTMLQKTTTLD